MAEDRKERVRRLQEELAHQHGPLLSVLRGLESMLESSPPAQGDLEQRLNRVADTLEAHIAEEEAGDLFRWVPETFDEVKAELDTLRAEHSPLLQTLRQLAIDTRGAETVHTSTDLSIRIRTVVADLRQHEARELAVLQALKAD